MTRPLLIFGIDAGDPDLIRGFARDGHLPAIASLMERGCWWQTTGPDMLFEHGIWMAICSGVSRARYGYHYLRQMRSGTYDLWNPKGADFAVPPFWSALEGTARKLAILDVPETWPIAGLPGVQVSEWAVHDPDDLPSSEPAGFLADVERIFGPRLIIREEFEAGMAQDLAICRQLMDRIERKGRLCRHLLSIEKYDLAFFVFGECHTGVHQFWKYFPGSTFEEKVDAENELTDAIRDLYRATDRELGTLLDAVPDANVVILCSVGLREHFPTRGLAESFCRKLGYTASPAPGRGGLMQIAKGIVPESWRIAVSRHFPRHMREGIVAGQFRAAADWTRTTAFALPAHYAGMLRVNLRGREPNGIVSPGAEYHAVLDKLESDLRQLVEPRSGRPAVERIFRIDESFGAGRSPELPDLFVEWRGSPYFVERLVHPRGEITQARPEFFRGTDHTTTGFVAAAGPSIHRRGDQGQTDVLNLAPTFLALLGIHESHAMDGKPIALA
ncbi:MAG: alkaline phosphatase family protein [Bryobacteraceae bacterium]